MLQCERPDRGTSISVPEDVIYTVLSHLKDDKPALSKCSVVCRTWLRYSRRYLFHTITLNYAMNGGLPIQRRGGLPAFAGFLRTCADARQYLQRLVLSAQLWRIASMPDLGPLELRGDELLGVLKAGGNIQQLTLDNVSWVDSGDAVVPSSRRTLKHLEIQQWIRSDEEVLDVLKLIAAFEHLDVLVLSLSEGFIEDTTGRLANHAETGQFPSVHSLVYETSPEWPATPLYRIMERSCQRHRDMLAHISFITWDSTDSWERITEFCRFICNSDVRFHLRGLEFNAGSGRTLWSAVSLPDWGVLNLSRLEALEQLTLALDCENVTYVGQELSSKLDAYAFVLRTRPPPALQQLTIKLYIPNNTDEELRRSRLEYMRRNTRRPAWTALDEASQALPTSPQIVFDCVGPWGDTIRCGAVGQCLQELLPRTHARGQLRWMISASFARWWDEDFP
ncbi:hypothetical protein GY45DRAFT_1150603 [Cubamyces sp. BRFM 1775]|nr:hypothetical protein GY45DRAFT_1150603 [Cubamyces sp. BRFM 1775]